MSKRTNIFRLDVDETMQVVAWDIREVMAFAIMNMHGETDTLNPWFLSDIMADLDTMQNVMTDNEPFVWSLRPCGTWCMGVAWYMAHVNDDDPNALYKFLVMKHDDTLEFTRIK